MAWAVDLEAVETAGTRCDSGTYFCGKIQDLPTMDKTVSWMTGPSRLGRTFTLRHVGFILTKEMLGMDEDEKVESQDDDQSQDCEESWPPFDECGGVLCDEIKGHIDCDYARECDERTRRTPSGGE